MEIDFVIDLQNNFRSRKIVRKIGVKKEKFIKPTISKILLVKFGLNQYDSIKSIPELYATNLHGVELDDKGLDLFLSPDISSSLLSQKNLIGFCPGAKHFTKRWPAEYYIELGKQLVKSGFDVVLFGGLDDIELCDFIAGQIPGSINTQHENNVLRIAADMKRCKAIVCNDTGLMHVASALNIPLLTIFGSSVKEFGFAPYKSANLLLENNYLSCRPCSHIGKAKCPKKHFDCMRKITPDYVMSEMQNFIREL